MRKGKDGKMASRMNQSRDREMRNDAENSGPGQSRMEPESNSVNVHSTPRSLLRGAMAAGSGAQGNLAPQLTSCDTLQQDSSRGKNAATISDNTDKTPRAMMRGAAAAPGGFGSLTAIPFNMETEKREESAGDIIRGWVGKETPTYPKGPTTRANAYINLTEPTADSFRQVVHQKAVDDRMRAIQERNHQEDPDNDADNADNADNIDAPNNNNNTSNAMSEISVVSSPSNMDVCFSPEDDSKPSNSLNNGTSASTSGEVNSPPPKKLVFQAYKPPSSVRSDAPSPTASTHAQQPSFVRAIPSFSELQATADAAANVPEVKASDGPPVMNMHIYGSGSPTTASPSGDGGTSARAAVGGSAGQSSRLLGLSGTSRGTGSSPSHKTLNPLTAGDDAANTQEKAVQRKLTAGEKSTAAALSRPIKARPRVSVYQRTGSALDNGLKCINCTLSVGILCTMLGLGAIMLLIPSGTAVVVRYAT